MKKSGVRVRAIVVDEIVAGDGKFSQFSKIGYVGKISTWSETNSGLVRSQRPCASHSRDDRNQSEVAIQISLGDQIYFATTMIADFLRRNLLRGC